MDKVKTAVSFLTDRIRKLICSINTYEAKYITEIRLRSNCPIAVRYDGKIMYLTDTSKLVYKHSNCLPSVSQTEMNDSFNRLCDYSVYTYLNDIKNGFISLKEGHRVGFCGQAVRDGEVLTSIKDISSFNIRIARQFTGCCDILLERMEKEGYGNIIVAGCPSSGKTTMLREIARKISNCGFNICVVDERQEIFPKFSNYDKGINTDVMLSYPKHAGIMTAVRTLSPDYIMTDEIGEKNECEAICRGLNSGINFVVSIHANDLHELKRKEIYKEITSCADFKYILILGKKECPGEIVQIVSSTDKEVKL